jgi:hypothetical protein
MRWSFGGRVRFAAAIVLQLLALGVPSTTIIVCMSPDGSCALEIALPGTTHCDEQACDEVRGIEAPPARPACRDVPLFGAADASAPAPAAGAHTPPAAAWHALLPFDPTGAGAPIAAVVRGAQATPSDRPARTTVLLL